MVYHYQKKRILGEYPVYGSNGIVGYHNNFLVEAPNIIVGRKGSAGEVNFANKNFTPIDTTFYVKPFSPIRNEIFILFTKNFKSASI
ncbi:restriction endonuclease subunit S [Brachyspira hyodysenteriae]|uniref:restriction endonuclease subunit S n=1 Tax=Brachyspira hyodysenteriae TaxID=159 RepID=UPI003BF4B8D5